MNRPDIAPIKAAPLPEVRNHTRFPSQYFQMMNAQDKVFHVLVSRVTYDLNNLELGGRPCLAEAQQPLIDADSYYGEPVVSTVIEESDFAPYKPKCDILITHAHAYAPHGKAQKRWPVAVRVGKCTKVLEVTGPRYMQHSLLGWWLTEPEAVKEVPLRYELAFGGTCRWPLQSRESGEPELLLRHEANPVGRGFAPREWIRKRGTERLEAPQIEEHKKPFDGNKDYPAAGFGAVGRWWTPRVKFAGTYDAEWKEKRWPRLPKDFDFAYWNCAPQDQQIDWPKGGEPVAFLGLTPGGGEFRARLPGNPPFVLTRLKAGPIVFCPMCLDTLVFDMQAMTLACVHRMTVSAHAGVRVLEIRQKDKA
jgi:hypothetical protein